jgi:hypothetical protein
MFWSRPKSTFVVGVHLDGRHPYLDSTELDYETRDITLTVPARDWNDAERVAMSCHMPRAWSRRVTSIARVK